MGLKSFKAVEENLSLTLPNALSVSRGVGGIALGIGLATGTVDPTTALVSAAVLGATDAEGLTITATSRLPRLQRALRIIPSTIGRKLDPVMDKVYGLSVLLGATIGGEVPHWQGAGIIGTEVATSVATLLAVKRGNDPEVSKIGTYGMALRVGTIVVDLTASALGSHTGLAHELLSDGGDALASASIALGALSCYKLAHDY